MAGELVFVALSPGSQPQTVNSHHVGDQASGWGGGGGHLRPKPHELVKDYYLPAYLAVTWHILMFFTVMTLQLQCIIQ